LATTVFQEEVAALPRSAMDVDACDTAGEADNISTPSAIASGAPARLSWRGRGGGEGK
jgi:hypothetical protein